MNRMLTLALLALFMLAGCDGYDDSSLREQLQVGSERIDVLSGQVARIRTALEALQGTDRVTAVEPIRENDETIGFTVRFRVAAPVVILLGSATDDGLSSVEISGDRVVFTLSDQSTVSLRYDAAPALTLAADTLYVAPGGSREVAYTVAGGDAGNGVEAVAEGYWRSEVVAETPFAGKIRVYAPAEGKAGKVLLVVADGAGRTGNARLVVMPMTTDESAKNRYSMTLYHQPDGCWLLAASQAAVLAGAEPEGLYEPVENPPLVGSSAVADVEYSTVVYKTYADRELHMNIAPAVGAAEPAPVVFFTHGGGWWQGDHNSLLKVARYVAKTAGAAGVSVQYSLAGQTNVYIETSVQDLRDALTWLEAHAADYNLDMSRVAFVGNSAGGHLSAVLAMTWPSAKVLVGWSGAYDLVEHLRKWGDGINRVQKYFHQLDSTALAPYSPVLLVPKSTERQVPCMLLHGTADNQVLFKQAPLFADALRAAGQTVQEEYYTYYSHGLVGSSDKNAECLAKTLDFIKANL